MSAFGGKADVNHYGSKGPLIAKSGHKKGLVDASLIANVMMSSVHVVRSLCLPRQPILFPFIKFKVCHIVFNVMMNDLDSENFNARI